MQEENKGGVYMYEQIYFVHAYIYVFMSNAKVNEMKQPNQT
jgi:hypothetical protein